MQPMMTDYRQRDFEKLIAMIDNHRLMKTEPAEMLDVKNLRSPAYRTKCVMRASLDDIALGINICKVQLGESGAAAADFGMRTEQPKSAKAETPYIKIMLQKTPDILLYEQRSITVLQGTDEGNAVEADNQQYEELLAGRDKTRRTVEADTQTLSALKKSRLVNTERIFKGHIGSYVSNFEMFDTYKDLETTTKSVDVDGQQKMKITTYKVGGVDQFVEINRMPEFKFALMLTMRILASNVYEKEQRRFRNMSMPDPLAEDVKYKYRLELLWRFGPPTQLAVPKAVSDLSICPSNGDIIAAAYGIYTFANVAGVSNCGYVYIWNIKNPVNPERRYNYDVPVAAVEFSKQLPQLLAIGLYNGNIEVRNIADAAQPPIAISHRSTSPSFEPVLDIKWIPQSENDIGGYKIDPFLAVSQDGTVTKYRIIGSPHLLGQVQNKLQRVDGELEGIPLERGYTSLLANRNAQCLSLTLDPLDPHLYYVLTDEGVMYTCSTNYPMQHLESRQIHETEAVYMEYSPWSPKLYLTCGSDWCIRIWMMGILQPLITLSYQLTPIHCAKWSRTHATIIVSLTRSTIDIWDLRNSTLKPKSSTNIDAKIYYTTFTFSHCGRSVAVGNEAGHLLMLAFEDMPFPPHFQYKQLKRAIYKALGSNPELKQHVKNIGYFGYGEPSKSK